MFSLKVQKYGINRTSDEKINAQVDYIIHRALSGSRGKGWTCSKICHEAINKNDKYIFSASLTFYKSKGSEELKQQQWKEICEMISVVGNGAKFANNPWRIVGDEEVFEIKPSHQPENFEKPITNINIDPTKYYDPSGPKFEDLFGRKHQKEIILAALRAAKETDFHDRYHTVLFGKPGAAKTDLLLAMANMLGKENEAYIKFDATSTTSAGVSKLLLSSNFNIPICIIEEIEKSDESSLRWLLGILDQRAEIRRTNYRIGNASRSVKMLVFATVNDIELFGSLMSGALASRFSNKIYCPRPSREILEKILRREIARTKGKEIWIEPALKFAFDEMGWTDPRAIKAICLQGREQLLDGSYQEAIRSTQLPKEIMEKL